jgi:glycerate 2-kinase
MYEAAVAGAIPETAVRHAVADLDLPRSAPVRIIALGKAAHAMTAGAVAALAAMGREPAGGVIVGPEPAPTPHQALVALAGDHPIPGHASLAAANAIGDAVAAVRAGDEVLALISGGGTALAAAPVLAARDFTQADLGRLYDLLLASGADVVAMNAVRKRFARWLGGRLGLALAPARVHALIVSDVLGDDLASISSGPCTPDPLTARDIRTRLDRARLSPHAVADPAARATLERAFAYLDAVTAGHAPETPKPHDAAFAGISTRIVVSNAHAVEAAAAHARAAGIDEVTVVEQPLVGEAAICGVRLASDLIARRMRHRGPHITRCVVWGGETTVTLGPTPGQGGRNQELALAAARSLADAGDRASGIMVLAAGTDGRDGPTDAAGAIVDGLTWHAVSANGRDPATDLATHNAYPALHATHSLLHVGHTGTNVMDVVIGLIM